MATIQEFAKAIARLSKTLAQLVKRKDGNEADVLALAEKALEDSKAVNYVAGQAELERLHGTVAKKLGDSLGTRREEFQIKAREAGVPFRRLDNFDQFDLLKLEYKREKVLVFVGSEKYKELAIADGTKLFEILHADLKKLRRPDFSRESFLQTLKLALALASEYGKAKEGRCKVRDLFPFFVSALQIAMPDFVKRPSKTSFREYSMAEFAYELARFGEDGWALGDQAIRSQPPNMASQKEALTLPRKAGVEGASTQVLSLWVER